jgi:Flp pilus assembly protein TadG
VFINSPVLPHGCKKALCRHRVGFMIFSEKPSGKLRRAASLFGGFARSERAATAVEFAVVAAPFFGLVFAITETALIFFSQETLETAVAASAREIRTGLAQQQGFSAAQFKDRICQQVTALLNCNGLMIDVRTHATFDSVDLNKPLNGNGDVDTTGFGYLPGHGSDIITVRAFYEWPVWSMLLGPSLSNLANGKHLLAATSAFRNEPFPW